MEQNEPTDAELVAHTLSGCRESYGHLYDRYAHVVRAVFRSIGFPWTVVDDLTQECFLRAFRKLRSLREPDKFGSWIGGIARHIAREQRRSRVRDRHEFAGDVEPSPVDPVDFTTDVQTSEEIRLMQEQLEQLPADERLAIHAFFLSEQSAPRAAKAMSLSRSGFYALLKRAIGRLASHCERTGSGKERP